MQIRGRYNSRHRKPLIVGRLNHKIVPICDKSTKLGIYVDKCIKNNSGYWGNGNTPPIGHSTTPHPQLAQLLYVIVYFGERFVKIFVNHIFSVLWTLENTKKWFTYFCPALTIFYRHGNMAMCSNLSVFLSRSFLQICLPDLDQIWSRGI